MRYATLATVLLVLPTAAAAQDAGRATTDTATSPAARTTTAVLPYVGSAPETGFQLGATVLRVRQLGDGTTRPSTSQLYVARTAKSQIRAFVEVDRWTAGNVWRLTTRVEWQRFPLPYYGVGDDTPEAAEEIYTPRGVLGHATAQRRLREALYAVAGYRFQDLDVVRTADDGVLRAGTVPGSRGGRVGQLQGGLLWDDRDNVFAPERGTVVQVSGFVAAGALGSEYDFRRLLVDARRYLRLGDRRVVAFQGVLEGTDGTAPFDQLSLVGSSNYLRGYPRGRYRDRHLASLQAEYRGPVAGRLGWAAFAGAGRVAARLGDLVDGDARVLPSYGVGARWLLFPRSRSTVRVDWGRGSGGSSGLYVAFNEAF